jgi:hypothetical protein
MESCCLKGFRWNSTPTGQETELAGLKCYRTGSDPKVAIMLIHDLYGWTFINTRLLADHLADEVGATVYVPDWLVNVLSFNFISIFFSFHFFFQYQVFRLADYF